MFNSLFGLLLRPLYWTQIHRSVYINILYLDRIYISVLFICVEFFTFMSSCKLFLETYMHYMDCRHIIQSKSSAFYLSMYFVGNFKLPSLSKLTFFFSNKCLISAKMQIFHRELIELRINGKSRLLSRYKSVSTQLVY